MVNFDVGREYSRADLLAAVGSRQAQSGIIWGPKEPGVVIITSGGRHSKSAGYGDNQNTDGSWEYFGQGTTGDQDQDKFANRLLIEGQRAVLLFSTRHPTIAEVQTRGSYASFYQYEGMFLVSSWDVFVPTLGKRAGHKLLRFHLVPSRNNLAFHLESDDESERNVVTPFNVLREELRQRDDQPQKGYKSTREFRRGSAEIRAYARLRADGICENCNRAAPFVDKDGKPFLEVHHIERLADDGPDIPVNVAAICPNCHREAHLGPNPEVFRAHLKKLIHEKELYLDSKLAR